MKIVIVVALVAVFQGCQSLAVDDLQESVFILLSSYVNVGYGLKTVMDSMVEDAQEVINTMLHEVAPSACVIALQEELEAVSDKASENASTCIQSAADETYIDKLFTSFNNSYNGLLNYIGKLVKNILACALNVILAFNNDIMSLPAEVLASIVDIINHLHSVLVSQLTCSNNAVVAAYKEIADILKKVKAC